MKYTQIGTSIMFRFCFQQIEFMSVIVPILALFGTFLHKSAGSLMINYVTPSGKVLCSHVQNPCLTFEEYAGEPNLYFINNSVFYFHPGNHRLDANLQLMNVHNLCFQGLPGNDRVNIIFDSAASITWERSSNIEISSISLRLIKNFTFLIRFELTLSVRLSNISIFGNGYSGCSSVLSQESTLHISNSNFVGIKGQLGAALMMLASKITFSGNNSFLNNVATSAGGGIYSSNSTLALNGTDLFLNNTSLMSNNNDILHKYPVSVMELNYHGSGGAIFGSTSSIAIYKHSTFIANTAKSSGGALAVYDGSIVDIQGTTLFRKNSAKRGGAMVLYDVTSRLCGHIFLRNNKGETGGAIVVRMGNIIIQGYISIEKNSARIGGAVVLSHTNSNFCGSIYFGKNRALLRGGGLLIKSRANGSFGEGCFYNSTRNSIIIFHQNIANFRGGAIYSHNSNLIFVARLLFTENMSIKLYGGAIHSRNSCMKFEGNTTKFTRNTAARQGGAISNIDSKLRFKGRIQFERNMAYIGGAIALEGTASKLILAPTLDMLFIMNYANNSGGALYFKDSQCLMDSSTSLECFIVIDSPFDTLESIKDIALYFVNNTVQSTGSVLFGGQLDKCQWNVHRDDALKIFVNLSTIVVQNPGIANISSEARSIEFCQEKKLSLHPGEQFNVTIKAIGQGGSPVPAKLLIDNNYGGDKYRLSPLSQYISGSCTNATFRLYSTVGNSSMVVKLYPENPCQSLAIGGKLSIAILLCPLGFELSNDQCVCNKIVQKFVHSCHIDNVSFERKRNNFWISQINGRELVIHNSRCPLDYCKDNSINVTLSDPNIQCNIYRHGSLCGQCQSNFSLALGSLHCIPCSNSYITLTLIFALAGVALVSIILLFRLTVALGTLNGLMFYANIIQASHQTFFPRTEINFFTIFLSLLNLDFGIETCFYDGMDIYAYSWFQFLFPFYVWFLIGCIILVCRRSQVIAKCLGQNPVAVLATLFLMSYSKILQAVIVPLSKTCLTYYNSTGEFHRIVWLYDGSIDFFKESKHIVLGLFAIFILVFFVAPYIFLLFFGHWLQGYSNLWILSWMNKLKPFMDAYHAPYRKHTRYWTGLLLLSRLGLFLTFAINTSGNEIVNVLAVSSVSLALLAIQRRVYEHWWKDLLESSCIFNLGVFSMATFYLKESEDANSQLILSSVSVGIAFTTFIGILLFHFSLVLKSSSLRFWKVYMLPFIQKSLLLSTILRIKDKTIAAGDADTAELRVLPTSTEIDVDLREPLLEITESQAAT